MKTETKDGYYDSIAAGYDELHKEEQEKKLRSVKQFIKPKKTDRLLDVGCGTGVSTQFDCVCYGIDPSEELLKIAGRKFPDKTFMLGSAEKLPFEAAYFDYIISLTAAQNFTNLEKAVSEINRVAKPGCKIAISILKKSPKAKGLRSQLKNYECVEEDKDLIFVNL